MRRKYLSENYFKFGQLVDIEEKTETGKGKVTFTSQYELTAITFNRKKRIYWLKSQKKCCDGAVIEQKQASTILHLIELKSGVGDTKIDDSEEQLIAGYIEALAVCGVLGVKPDEVILYLAGKQLRPDSTSSEASLNKVLLGQKALKTEIELDGYGPAPLKWIHRDIERDGGWDGRCQL